MKKNIKPFITIIFVIAVIVLIILFVLNNNKNNYILTVKESSWSGWSENHEPQETTKEYEVKLGKKYTVNYDVLSFRIIRIKNDSIVIRTNEPFSEDETGINLNTSKRKFTIYLNKELILTTPTTDAGSIYYFNLKKK